MFPKFSKKQWMIILVYSFVSLLSAFCLSLLGSFYPSTANEKGATNVQSTMIIEVISCVIFFASPLSGMVINRFGVSKASIFGLFTIAIIDFIFVFVGKIEGPILFISLSFIIRMFEGMGFALVRNAAVAIIVSEFSLKIDVGFGIIQAWFFVGLLLGPLTGEALFELGGFILPLAFTSAFLFFTIFFVIFLQRDYPKQERNSTCQVFKMFRLHSVLTGILSVFGGYFNVWFILTTLEPHLEKLKFTQFEMRLLVLVNLAAYAIFSFIWGKMCENFKNSVYICSVSSFITIGGLLLIGPAPFLLLDVNIYTCVFGLIIQAIGIGGELVAGFSCLSKGALLAGFPQTIQTYSLISTIFTSLMALGIFIGPLVGRSVFNGLGFPWGSQIFVLYHLLLAVGIIVSTYFSN